jgi:predicted negative regulator of RcsB-dependent stress response
MSIHHSEEEQIESLKKWWKENGPSVLFGVVIGLAGLFGWNAWQDHKLRQATEASALYNELLIKMEAKQASEQYDSLIETLRKEYDDTAYAALAALAAAKFAVERDNVEAAIDHLEWAIRHAQQPEIQITAKLRLSRLLLAQGKFDRVEYFLGQLYPKAYTAAVEELRGDLMIAKGNPANARQAYQRALAASEIAPYTRQLIQNKLDQLVSPEPADA